MLRIGKGQSCESRVQSMREREREGEGENWFRSLFTSYEYIIVSYEY